MPVKKTAKSKLKQIGFLPGLLIIIGIVILAVGVFLFKNQSSNNASLAGESPEAQYDRYMGEKKPTLVFYHSLDCHSCIVMMDTVGQVYPEFKGDVALVDVNVYDPQNRRLLQRAGITSIPTLIFIDHNGGKKVSIGVMEADALREQLIALKEQS